MLHHYFSREGILLHLVCKRRQKEGKEGMEEWGVEGSGRKEERVGRGGERETNTQ